MSADLIGVLRLVHRVSGFLLALTPAQLTNVADGRLVLTVRQPEEPPGDLPPAAPTSLPAVTNTRPARKGGGGVKPKGAAPTPSELAEIAETLRGQESVADGRAYLEGLPFRSNGLSRDDLVALASHLNLPMQKSIVRPRALDAVLKHTIGNRRQAEGLRP